MDADGRLGLLAFPTLMPRPHDKKPSDSQLSVQDGERRLHSSDSLEWQRDFSFGSTDFGSSHDTPGLESGNLRSREGNRSSVVTMYPHWAVPFEAAFDMDQAHLDNYQRSTMSLSARSSDCNVGGATLSLRHIIILPFRRERQYFQYERKFTRTPRAS